MAGGTRHSAAARRARRSVLRRGAALLTAAALVGLVLGDLLSPRARSWWDHHSFTSCVVSSLLVVGVTALIFDEVLARRQRQERSVTVAVQGVIVYGQTVRAYRALVVEPDGGPPGAEARDELRGLANMILIGSPALFDDPTARRFLEDVQRLAAWMARAATAPGAGTAVPRAGLQAAMARVDESVKPLMGRLPAQDAGYLSDESRAEASLAG